MRGLDRGLASGRSSHDAVACGACSASSGYVPVDAGIFQELSWLAEYLTERHVCVFVESDLTPSNRLGSLFTRLDSARRHVVLVFGRPGMHRGQRWMSLERMGVTAMTGMVFADREQGPAPHEILNAARAADGRPGVCLERLGGNLTNRFDRHALSFMRRRSLTAIRSRRLNPPANAWMSGVLTACSGDRSREASRLSSTAGMSRLVVS